MPINVASVNVASVVESVEAAPLIRVFVYGTLKPGEVNHRVCEPYVVAAHPAIAPGRLYQLPFDYPAMTPDDPGEVQGCLLTFTDPRILGILDAFEQHDPDVFQRLLPDRDIHHHQYQRQQIALRSPTESAWAYVMTRHQIEQLNGIAVPSGQWSGGGILGYKD